MPRLAPQMPDVLLRQLLLEFGLPAPVRVGRTIVREDLPRRAVLGEGPPQDLQHVPGGGPHVQAPAHDKARVVVQKSDQLRLPGVPETHREDVRLPHLAGLRTLEAPDHVLVPPPLDLHRRHALTVQGPPHALAADAKLHEAPQGVADPSDAPAGIILLGLHDLPYNRLRQRTHMTTCGLALLLALGPAPVALAPLVHAGVAQPHLAGDAGAGRSGSLQKPQGSGLDLGWMLAPTDKFCRRPPPSPLGRRGGLAPSCPLNVFASLHGPHSSPPGSFLPGTGMCQPIAGVSSGHSSCVGITWSTSSRPPSGRMPWADVIRGSCRTDGLIKLVAHPHVGERLTDV